MHSFHPGSPPSPPEAGASAFGCVWWVSGRSWAVSVSRSPPHESIHSPNARAFPTGLYVLYEYEVVMNNKNFTYTFCSIKILPPFSRAFQPLINWPPSGILITHFLKTKMWLYGKGKNLLIFKQVRFTQSANIMQLFIS